MTYTTALRVPSVTLVGPIWDAAGGPELWLTAQSDALIDLPSAAAHLNSIDRALLAECSLPTLDCTTMRDVDGWRYDTTWALAYPSQDGVR